MIMGIKALVENESQLELCGHSSKHETLIDELRTATPDAVILDLTLYTHESLDFIRNIREHFPDLGIIVLSVHTEADYVVKAREAGADSYIIKTEEPKNMIEAIHATIAGGNYTSSRIRPPGEIKAPPSDSPINLLSRQQFKILQLVGKGRTNRQIAEELALSPKTIEQETESIQRELDLSSPVELLQFAFHWVHHEGGFS
jgi:DNA-binding NarL/FixJ family response regulator